MASKARWIAIAVAVFGSAAVLWAQPAINLFNQRLVLDANGSLIVKTAAYAGSPGPATVAANTRVKTDASNNLIVAIGAGTSTPDVMCLDATNQDVCLHRSASGVLLLDNAASGGTSFTGIQFGGTTGSFPRLERNLTSLNAKLADGSGFTLVKASDFETTNSEITNGSGTGITPIFNGPRQSVHQVTIASTAFVCAAVTCDVTIATLPAKTFVSHVIADLTTTFACASTCTTATLSFVLGKTAGGNQYLLSADADAATGQFGATAATLGASLAPATAQTLIGDLASWTATTAIVLRMTSGTGNIGTGAVTNFSQGSVTFDITTVRVP